MGSSQRHQSFLINISLLLALWHLSLPLACVADELPHVNAALLKDIRQQYGSAAEQRVIRLRQLIGFLQGKPEEQQLASINRFFNQLRFVDDRQHWEREDYWATPLETLASNGGDCEDFAIAKYYTLKQLGIPASKMRLTYVKAVLLNQAHMVLTYYQQPDASPLVLDNLVDDIRIAAQRKDLVPVYSFNGDGLWQAKQQGGARLGNADDIVMWRELRDRMARALGR